jgi:hypothetical protein
MFLIAVSCHRVQDCVIASLFVIPIDVIPRRSKHFLFLEPHGVCRPRCRQEEIAVALRRVPLICQLRSIMASESKSESLDLALDIIFYTAKVR